MKRLLALTASALCLGLSACATDGSRSEPT